MELINIRLSNGKEEILSYSKIPCIIKDGKITFVIDDTKTTISNEKLIRENKEQLFILDISNKKSTYTLKEQKYTVDIEVEKVSYKQDNKNIELIYKILSNEEELTMNIEREK